MDRSSRERLQPGELPDETHCRDEGGGPPEWMPDSASAHRRMSRLVQTLQSDIIPRLVKGHRLPREADSLAAEPWPDILGFARQCHAADDSAMHAIVRSLRASGVTVERLYLELLAPAARELGRLWEADLCDFTDVTVGVGRLQQLLRELSPAFGAEVDVPADGRRILLLPAPGEQHTLGTSMVAEFFRRAGWDVVGGVGGSGLDPVQAVQREWFDILGLSVGHSARLDWLRESIVAVRQVSRNRDIGVLVGGPLFAVAPEYGQSVGADVSVIDGQRGPEVAERLLASRPNRL